MISSKKAIIKRNSGLYVIGIIKLVSAVLLIALGFGIFHLLDGNTANILDHYVRMLHLDMENKYLNTLLAKISGVNPVQLKKVGIVTFIFASLYIIEGIGLLMKKHWAEYLTIIITFAFIPIEIYEVIRRLSAQRISVLIINVIIIVYLIYRLRIDKRRKISSTGFAAQNGE